MSSEESNSESSSSDEDNRSTVAEEARLFSPLLRETIGCERWTAFVMSWELVKRVLLTIIVFAVYPIATAVQCARFFRHRRNAPAPTTDVALQSLHEPLVQGGRKEPDFFLSHMRAWRALTPRVWICAMSVGDYRLADVAFAECPHVWLASTISTALVWALANTTWLYKYFSTYTNISTSPICHYQTWPPLALFYLPVGFSGVTLLCMTVDLALLVGPLQENYLRNWKMSNRLSESTVTLNDVKSLLPVLGDASGDHWHTSQVDINERSHKTSPWTVSLFTVLVLICLTFMCAGPWASQPILHALHHDGAAFNCTNQRLVPTAVLLLAATSFYTSTVMCLGLTVVISWILIVLFSHLSSAMESMWQDAKISEHFLERDELVVAAGARKSSGGTMWIPEDAGIHFHGPISGILGRRKFDWSQPQEQIRFLLYYRLYAAKFAEAEARLNGLMFVVLGAFLVVIVSFILFVVSHSAALIATITILTVIIDLTSLMVIFIVLVSVVLVRATRVNEFSRRHMVTLRSVRRALRADRILFRGAARWSAHATVRLLVHTVRTARQHALQLSFLGIRISSSSVGALLFTMMVALGGPVIALLIK